MSQTEEIIKPRRPLDLSWPAALSLFTALVAAGTVIFDAQLQRGRVLALEKLEVVSSRIPKLSEGVAP